MGGLKAGSRAVVVAESHTRRGLLRTAILSGAVSLLADSLQGLQTPRFCLAVAVSYALRQGGPFRHSGWLCGLRASGVGCGSGVLCAKSLLQLSWIPMLFVWDIDIRFLARD